MHFRPRPTTLHFTDGVQEFPTAIGFGDISVKANSLPLVQKPFGLEDGVSQYCSVREKVFYRSCCLKPVDEWHRNIEDHEVRLELLGPFDGDSAIASLPTDDPIILRFQQ